MVQTAENRTCPDAMAARKLVTGVRYAVGPGFRWNSRTQGSMRASVVVMSHPLRKKTPQMALAERKDPIQTLAPGGADHSLTERVRLRRPDGRLQHSQAHRSERIVHNGREDRVVVVNHESIYAVSGGAISELLDRPFGCRMCRHVPVHDPPRREVEDEEHVDARERRRHRQKKSQASTSRAWLCRNVLQDCDREPLRDGDQRGI